MRSAKKKSCKDVAVIATRLMVPEALTAADMLAEKSIQTRAINMYTITPLDEKLVLAAAKKCGKVITCEEHSVIGGLGEAVSHLLSEKFSCFRDDAYEIYVMLL